MTTTQTNKKHKRNKDKYVYLRIHLCISHFQATVSKPESGSASQQLIAPLTTAQIHSRLVS